MNKLFNALDNLFESQESVVLNERGAKYLKPDETDTDKNIDDRGIQSYKKGSYRYNDEYYTPLKPGAERYLYDVVKHLAPAGYQFAFSKDRYDRGTYSILLKGAETTYNIGTLNISIDNNDNVDVQVRNSNNKIPDIFGRKASLKEIGVQLAHEKGVEYNEDFLIDNGAEIRERFNNQKSEGTVEDLLDKISKQIKKLPSSKLVGYTESVENTKEVLDEAFSDSCPNWLKNTLVKMNKGRVSGYSKYSGFTDGTEFEPVPTDKIKGKDGLIALTKEAVDNHERLFVRTNYGVLEFDQGRWRKVGNFSQIYSSEDVANSIIAAVKTTNRSEAMDKATDSRKDREEAKKGSVDRVDYDDLDKWDREGYDKSGYRLDPNKYQRMLRDLNRTKLANSDLINNLKTEDYVNRFNEIGAKAKQFIADNLNIDYDNTSPYRGFDADIVEKVQKAAKSAKSFIEDLMSRLEYVKTGSTGTYSSKPSNPDVEAYVKEAMDRVDSSLTAFDQIVTKAEEMTESVKLAEADIHSVWMKYQSQIENAFEGAKEEMDEDTFKDFCGGIGDMAKNYEFGYGEDEMDEPDNLNEAEYTPNARKCIDAANLLGQIDLSDVEDAAKIKDSIDKLFDKLVRLAPRIDKREKKEQKEIEEASSNEDSELVKAAKANMEKIKNNPIDPENKNELDDKAEKVVKAMTMKEKYEIGKKYYEAYSKASSAEEFLNECGQDLQDTKNMRYFKYVMKDKGKNEDLHSVIECMKSAK